MTINRVLNNEDKKKILIVEDDDINQLIVSELISQKGFYSNIANNGQEAVNSIKNDGKYDLIFMDLLMPVMDGITATSEIRKYYDHNDLPVVGLTSDDSDATRQECLLSGMNDIIHKPINPDDITLMIDKWINSKAQDEQYSIDNENKHTISPDETITFELKYINSQEGLRRVDGNKNLYLELLVKYRKMISEFIPQIKELIRNKDFSSAERLAHTLKGVSGNIGCSSIQINANSIEELLRNNNLSSVNDSLINFNEIIDLVITELTNYDLPVFQKKQQYLVKENSLETLKEYLLQNNAKAVGIIKELEKRRLFESDYSELIALVKSYRFQEALMILNEILSKKNSFKII